MYVRPEAKAKCVRPQSWALKSKTDRQGRRTEVVEKGGKGEDGVGGDIGEAETRKEAPPKGIPKEPSTFDSIYADTIKNNSQN